MMLRRVAAVQRLTNSVFSLLALVLLLATLPISAQQASAGTPKNLVTQPVDNSNLVPLRGNVHPLARPEFDRGAAADSLALHRMLLLLGRSPAQETALRSYLEEQQIPGSASYHKWLTPAQFGRQFGLSDADILAVTSWLTSQGLHVTRVANGRSIIEFDGTAGELQQAFHTHIHKYVVNGKGYWANDMDPQVPSALAPVVKGFASLNNFPRQHYSHLAGNYRRNLDTGVVSPELTTSNGYYGLAPVDFATIYNSLPLLSNGIDGTGETIALVGETNVNASDIADFRNVFGLGAGHTQIVLDGPDPGITTLDEEMEADLDVEWSSAVAPGATVELVIAASTEVTQGIDLSALYIVEHNLAGVMSESYGGCEAEIGGGNQYYSSLWEQAAAQGITAVVSSGDSSAAGCDSPNSPEAQGGLGVNGIGSTPFNVSAGGTDYNDAGNFAAYWTTSNTQVTAGSYTLNYVSALGYIPEMTWNDSCADTAQTNSLSVCAAQNSGVGGLILTGGGGGRSSCATASCSGYPKPSWQVALTPNDSVRDVPDISYFTAAGESSSRSFYVLCDTDVLPSGETACVEGSNHSINFSGVGGTSAASPAFAGTVALAMQKAGSRLGNVDYLLYSAAQSTPSSFHDVTTGNISTPCLAGSPNCSSLSGAVGVLVDANSNPAYPAITGYDLATGLGTPNIDNLVSALAGVVNARSTTSTALTLNGGSATVTAAHGAAISVATAVTNSSKSGAGPAGDVAIISSTGAAIDGASSSFPLTAGASGQSSASWSSTLFPGGTYSAYASYSGDGANAPSVSSKIQVKITPENSQVFAIMEECNTSQITAIVTGSASVSYGSCYRLRYDVGDTAATFLGMTAPVVSSKCVNGTASCPTGNLSVTDNGQPLDGGSIMLNTLATAEDDAIQLTGGSHTIVAAYPGDASYNASSGQIAVTVSPVNTTISQPTATPAAPTVNQSVQLVADITTSTYGAAPTGTVTFTDNGVPLAGNLTMTGTPSSGAKTASTLAVLTASFSASGTHTVKAQYKGDTNYNASALSAAVTISVSPATPVTPTIAAPVSNTIPVLSGVTITLMTSISPPSGSGNTVAPTGTVIFYDGTTALSGNVSYSTTGTTLSASINPSFASIGAHSITAQYSGDGNFTAVTSVASSISVVQSVTLSLSQTAITASGAGSGSVTLTLTPASGFTGQVDVSCSATSPSACTPASGTPSGVNVTSGTSATTTIGYTVPGLSSALQPQHTTALKPLAGIAMAGLFLFAVPRMRRHASRILFVLLLAGAACLTACGGGGSGGGGGTNPVTYTFTVNAALHNNSSVSSTTQFTVTVQ